MMSMFNEWCGESDEWKKIAETSYEGKVTGIINSSKKCGVFVEIPSLMITGMITGAILESFEAAIQTLPLLVSFIKL